MLYGTGTAVIATAVSRLIAPVGVYHALARNFLPPASNPWTVTSWRASSSRQARPAAPLAERGQAATNSRGCDGPMQERHRIDEETAFPPSRPKAQIVRVTFDHLHPAIGEQP
jgi:hypothetical protein